MRQFLTLLVTSFVLFFPIYAKAIPNDDNPTTFLGAFAHGGFTTTLTDTSAYSLAGEAGARNYRIGGTIGWYDMGSVRAKLSADYLWQRINYPFFNANAYKWVSQGTLGGDYQYTFDEYVFNPQFDLNAYISHATNNSLSTISGSYINQSAQTIAYVLNRRIAGSNAFGVSPGFNMQPWNGSNFGVSANYDNVRYDTAYSNSDAKGFGATTHISQMLAENIEVGLLAAVRNPYNNYQANLKFATPTSYGTWIFGVNGTYTIGKNSLPSTYNIGFNAYFLLDCTHTSGESQRLANTKFLSDIAQPAVYTTQVLAIMDQRVL